MSEIASPIGNELDMLTPRQRETFVLAAKGYTVAEIGAMLHRSPSVISAHMTRAHQETELTTIEIIVLMAKAGWV